MKHKFIIVEGPIGVGKTTLVDLLGKELNAQIMYEEGNENPFLEKFYTDKKAYAFQTQIYFLVSRYKQHQQLIQPELFKKVTICDYMFAKDKIFAYLNLDEKELVLYEKLYAMLKSSAPVPDLVIYLQADVHTLIHRIRQRGKQYEQKMSIEYLEELIKAYNHFFFNYNESPLLVVNTNNVDFVHKPGDFHNLLDQIKNMSVMTKYYTPVGV